MFKQRSFLKRLIAIVASLFLLLVDRVNEVIKECKTFKYAGIRTYIS